MADVWSYEPSLRHQTRWFDEPFLQAVFGMGCCKSLELSVKWMEDYRIININGL